jgi:lysozyme
MNWFARLKRPEPKPAPQLVPKPPSLSLIDVLKRDEGLRLKPYEDSVGKLTIGYGRNLEDVGISEAEAEALLRADIAKAEREAAKYPWFAGLDSARKAVVVSMIFNLGPQGFAGFKNTIADIAAARYDLAASRMLQSKWADQVGNRAIRLAAAMRTGVLK